jgi:hypothetical protein
MRFEITVELNGNVYDYKIAFEFPDGFKEMRVLEEKLSVDGEPIYTRELAQVRLARMGPETEATFRLDWHLVALPIVHEQTSQDPLAIFKKWLARILILKPIPSLILGESEQETLEPNAELTDFAEWFSGLMAESPRNYSRFENYLKDMMPDLTDIQNPLTGKDSRSLTIAFSNDLGSLKLPLDDLSDGEKCFMICALVLAANESYGPLLCFWDEPDNYLALSEVGHFVLALRKAFQSGGQFIATSHNDEAIRSFSDENTLLLYRKSHLEPTLIRPISEMEFSGDLVDALVRDDVKP